MSADFEVCPVGTLARLRRVEELARSAVVGRDTSLRAFIAAMKALEGFFSAELQAERQADAADRMRDALEDR